LPLCSASLTSYDRFNTLQEHVKHLKQLKAIKALGPNPHVRTPGGGMNNRQVQIERASIANWRW
jgi:uncharacterized protein YciI